ncbi:hypothetical protein [Thermus thermophilus]|nr:hypothetical protein [Thermus thermophilus]
MASSASSHNPPRTLEEAARRLGENAEALLSRVNRSVEVRGPDRRRKGG